MPRARQILTILVALAVVLAPVSAPARAMMAEVPAHAAHAMHHVHAGMHGAASQEKASKPCPHKGGLNCGCEDKGACAQTCLQKCFGQIAVMPSERVSQKVLGFRLAPCPAARPPGWASAPQLPPPRV